MSHTAYLLAVDAILNLGRLLQGEVTMPALLLCVPLQVSLPRGRVPR